MNILVIRSFVIGLFLGIAYGCWFALERRMIARRGEWQRSAQKALFRYMSLVGILFFFLGMRLVSPWGLAGGFLIGFWGVVLYFIRVAL